MMKVARWAVSPTPASVASAPEGMQSPGRITP
jgi:hypothetical protein